MGPYVGFQVYSFVTVSITSSLHRRSYACSNSFNDGSYTRETPFLGRGNLRNARKRRKKKEKKARPTLFQEFTIQLHTLSIHAYVGCLDQR